MNLPDSSTPDKKGFQRIAANPYSQLYARRDSNPRPMDYKSFVSRKLKLLMTKFYGVKNMSGSLL